MGSAIVNSNSNGNSTSNCREQVAVGPGFLNTIFCMFYV